MTSNKDYYARLFIMGAVCEMVTGYINYSYKKDIKDKREEFIKKTLNSDTDPEDFKKVLRIYDNEVVNNNHQPIIRQTGIGWALLLIFLT